jgi:hypothetical protein
MTLAKTQHDQEAAQLQHAAQAKAVAENQAQQAFVKAEFARLAEIAPDLADPATGQEKRTAVTQYLVKQGIAPEAIQHISAAEMLLAHKAMRFDEIQAAVAAKPKPKPAAPLPKSPVRPAAGTSHTPQSSADTAKNRFVQTKSVDDAVALLLARRA